MRKVERVVVFWTAEDRLSFISSELAAGRLRQGWGIPGAKLTENGRAMAFDPWAQSFLTAGKKYWDWTGSIDDCKRRHSILARMLQIERGDLIVVPKMPSAEEFSIARADGDYKFDDSRFEDYYPDFGHVIPVDTSSIKSFRTRSSTDAAAIATKFRHYRSAVNNVNDTVYADKIRRIYAVESASI